MEERTDGAAVIRGGGRSAEITADAFTQSFLETTGGERGVGSFFTKWGGEWAELVLFLGRLGTTKGGEGGGEGEEAE